MEAERWQQIKEIAGAALARAPEARADFLRASCDDAELRSQVESLLSEEIDAGSFIERPLFERAADDDGPPPGRSHIGAYRLLRRLARGGMGEVYLAERNDEEFEQRVAIKLIKRGMDTEEIVRRFRYERQILANLAHPNIAELYDGGSTEDGLPYFVMEHIDGEPIDLYCESRDLGLRRRLELFRTVCEAVGFAHRNLVVHRDLKPANVLVTAAGVPKLLDFGISKLLSADGSPEPTRTELAGRLATPGYASPEQLRGERVTTTSDVYSLGVVLYVLLAGERPFEDRDPAGLGLLDATVLERLPQKPSSAVRRRGAAASEPARRLRRGLSGDLDAIVLKALRPDPKDRYASVDELVADLDRYLDGRPVRARKGSWLYHAGKALRRHRVAAAGAGLVLILAGSVAYSLVQQENAVRQQERADQESQKATAIQDYMVGLLEEALPDRARGGGAAAREILEKAKVELEGSLSEQPEVRSSLLDVLGVVYRRLGLSETARELAGESVEIRAKTYGLRHPLTLISRHNLANALRAEGELAEAFEVQKETVALAREVFPTDHLELTKMLNNLAGLEKAQGRFEIAIEHYREVLAVRERLSGGHDSEELASVLSNLGSCLDAVGRHDEANELLRRALDMRRRLLEEPDSDIAATLNNLAANLCYMGEYAEAEPLYRESLEMRTELFDPGHPAIYSAQTNLATCLGMKGDFETAEPLLRRAIGDLEAGVGRSIDLADAYRELAGILLAAGRAEEAFGLAERSLEVFGETDLERGHWRIADAESVLGGCHLALGRIDRAEPLIRRGYQGVAAVKHERSRQVREARERLAALEAALSTPG